MTVTRAAIVAKARELVAARVPYHHGQASRAGCDCIGLIRLIATELDLFDGTERNPAIKQFLGYGTEPRPEWMRAALTNFMHRVALPLIPSAAPQQRGQDRIDTTAFKPATVLWLKVDVSEPRHLVITTPHGVIHCRRDIGFVVEHSADLQWWSKNEIVAGWDYPGVID